MCVCVCVGGGNILQRTEQSMNACKKDGISRLIFNYAKNVREKFCYILYIQVKNKAITMLYVHHSVNSIPLMMLSVPGDP